jgi:hypothetical protein
MYAFLEICLDFWLLSHSDPRQLKRMQFVNEMRQIQHFAQFDSCGRSLLCKLMEIFPDNKNRLTCMWLRALEFV